MTEVNVEGVGVVADAVAIPVIASGGVASVADIAALKARPGVAITGAVYSAARSTMAPSCRWKPLTIARRRRSA